MHPWQPSASIHILQQRAKILQEIRAFFSLRDIWEVETPLLSHTTVTDPFIQSFSVVHPYDSKPLYLQTSPEYAMKRLLATGSGPIYQITKAFRQEESGRYHHPEFTMLEWYRPNYDHHQLMDEVDALLQCVLHSAAAKRMTYSELFQNYLQINPFFAKHDVFMHIAKKYKLNVQTPISDRDTWLQLLMSHCIEPQIGQEQPFFIYDFPPSQAALAKIREKETPPVASRFEVYFKGIELANGFHELQNAEEQRMRFEKDNQHRQKNSLPIVPIDEQLLAALVHGLPDCSGVALGLDRLMIIALQKKKLSEAMSFCDL